MIRFNTFIPNIVCDVVFINDLDLIIHTDTYTSNNNGIIRASIPIISDGLYYVYCTETTNFSNCLATAEIYVKNNIAIDANTHAILSAEIDAGFSLEEITKLSASALLGKSTMSGSVIRFTDIGGTVTRITSTVDGNGNRQSVTLNDI